MTNARQLANEAAAQIGDRLGEGFEAAVVLGTGWDDAVVELGDAEAPDPHHESCRVPGLPRGRPRGHRGCGGGR